MGTFRKRVAKKEELKKYLETSEGEILTSYLKSNEIVTHSPAAFHPGP